MPPFQKKLFHLADFPLYTKRLVIRPLRVSDAEPAYKFMDLDKDVSRFINRANSLKQKLERFEKLVHGYRAENYGYFAITPINSDHRMIGWVGLTPLEKHPYTQLLYGLAKPYWGQGYASEAADAMVRYAFRRMQLDMLVAVVNPENAASRKLIEKLGMSFCQQIDWPRQGTVDLFAMTRDQYQPKAA
jgi:ribosomal-protein-alanine N-acetyltransferase